MGTICELNTRTAELDAELESMKSLENNFWLVIKKDDDRTGAVEIAKLILEKQRYILDLLDKLIWDREIGNIKATRIMNELDEKVHSVFAAVFS